MISIPEQTSRSAGIIRSVCKFKDSAMTLRYAAAGFLKAEHGFRRIKGYKQTPILQSALARLTESGDRTTQESTYNKVPDASWPCYIFSKFHNGWDRVNPSAKG